MSTTGESQLCRVTLKQRPQKTSHNVQTVEIPALQQVDGHRTRHSVSYTHTYMSRAIKIST